MELLALEQVTHRYGRDAPAVDDLTFTVERGEVFGLLGHNGAGKTTTVRLLNGLIFPASGTVRVNGLDPVTCGPAVRAQTGVLTESPSLDDRLTARQNLRLFARMYGLRGHQAQARAAELLDDFRLAERGNERVGAYSRGMKQRLALARALIQRPQILFMDEPPSGLDPVATRHVHELIASLSHRQGVTIVPCTHNLDEAQSLCHRVAVLQSGLLLALGSPADLARQLPDAVKLLVEVPDEYVDQVAAILDSVRPDLVIAVDAPYLVLTGADRTLAP
jgi:ABC-2 type transport system ATP-binding protein